MLLHFLLFLRKMKPIHVILINFRPQIWKHHFRLRPVQVTCKKSVNCVHCQQYLKILFRNRFQPWELLIMLSYQWQLVYLRLAPGIPIIALIWKQLPDFQLLVRVDDKVVGHDQYLALRSIEMLSELPLSALGVSLNTLFFYKKPLYKKLASSAKNSGKF